MWATSLDSLSNNVGRFSEPKRTRTSRNHSNFRVASTGTRLRVVNTTWGQIRGEVVSPGADDLPAVVQYLGVPYGIAPQGQVIEKGLV